MENVWESPRLRRIAFTGLVVAGLTWVLTMNSRPELIGSSTADFGEVVAAVDNLPAPTSVAVGGGQQSYEGSGYVEETQYVHYDKSFSSNADCGTTLSEWMDSLDQAGYFYDIKRGTSESSIRIRDSKYNLVIDLYKPVGSDDCLGMIGARAS